MNTKHRFKKKYPICLKSLNKIYKNNYFVLEHNFIRTFKCSYIKKIFIYNKYFIYDWTEMYHLSNDFTIYSYSIKNKIITQLYFFIEDNCYLSDEKISLTVLNKAIKLISFI